jgi:hypothetical protein
MELTKITPRCYWLYDKLINNIATFCLLFFVNWILFLLNLTLDRAVREFLTNCFSVFTCDQSELRSPVFRTSELEPSKYNSDFVNPARDQNFQSQLLLENETNSPFQTHSVDDICFRGEVPSSKDCENLVWIEGGSSYGAECKFQYIGKVGSLKGDNKNKNAFDALCNCHWPNDDNDINNYDSGAIRLVPHSHHSPDTDRSKSILMKNREFVENRPAFISVLSLMLLFFNNFLLLLFLSLS